MKTCICVRANILRDGARDYCSVRGYVYAPPQSIGILCECEYACLCIRERFVLVHVFVSHFVVRLCVCACVVRSFVNVYVLIFCMFRLRLSCFRVAFVFHCNVNIDEVRRKFEYPDHSLALSLPLPVPLRLPARLPLSPRPLSLAYYPRAPALTHLEDL